MSVRPSISGLFIRDDDKYRTDEIYVSRSTYRNKLFRSIVKEYVTISRNDYGDDIGVDISQKQAAELIPILQAFVDTGELPKEVDSK